MTMTPVPPEMKRLVPFELALREAGMAYPEVTEDFPWGHRTLKVKGKAARLRSLKSTLKVVATAANGVKTTRTLKLTLRR